MRSSALTRLALRMQRRNIALPQSIRAPLRTMMLRLTEGELPEIGVEDWSAPLIPGRRVEVDSQARLDATLVEPCGGASLRSRREEEFSLRCLLATSSLDAGGMDEVVAFLALRLTSHGILTAVLHASSNARSDGRPTGRLGRLLETFGVTTVELPNDVGAQWLKAWRPDVISAHDAPPWVLETAGELLIPYVETLHGMHSLFSRAPALETQRGERLARIVAVSDLVRRQYLQINPRFPQGSIVTIPNGVDDRRRGPGDREQARTRWGIEDEYVFVSLARHCLQKNTYGLIEAFSDVAASHPEAHLVIAGRPDDRAYFCQVAARRAELRCRDRIHLRDHTANPAELLALADGFVLDSFFEGWSLASMEALYAGVPVVVSDVGGAREQVDGDETRGYVVPNPLGDPLLANWDSIRAARYARQVNREALVAAMRSLIAHRRCRLAARPQLIAESAERFHPDLCLRSYAGLLTATAVGG